MKRYAIIPTRESVTDCKNKATTVGKLNDFLTKAGWEVHFIRQAESMLGALRTGIEECGVTFKDYVIFCHDDIEVLNNREVFMGVLDAKLKDSTTGFVGVAGTSHLTEEINWYACALRNNSGGGSIYHGADHESMNISAFGPKQTAVTLDGVFLACKGDVLLRIKLRSPAAWNAKWHHYDTWMTFQAYLGGRTNHIAPLSLRHASGGSYDAAYAKDIPKVANSFAKHLPAIIY